MLGPEDTKQTETQPFLFGASMTPWSSVSVVSFLAILFLSLICRVACCPLIKCHHFPQFVPGSFSFTFYLYFGPQVGSSRPMTLMTSSVPMASRSVTHLDCLGPQASRFAVICHHSKFHRSLDPKILKINHLSSQLYSLLLDSMSWIKCHHHLPSKLEPLSHHSAHHPRPPNPVSCTS